MQSKLIIPGQTYLIDTGGCYKSNFTIVKIISKKQGIRRTRQWTIFEAEILDKILNNAERPVVTSTIAASPSDIMCEISEEFWKEYKEDIITKRLKRIFNSMLSEIGDVIRSFKEYMK